jgi:hypothetical protein
MLNKYGKDYVECEYKLLKLFFSLKAHFHKYIDVYLGICSHLASWSWIAATVLLGERSLRWS